MQNKKVYYSLDIFRGLAALWVVMAHACGPMIGTHMDMLSNPLYAFSIRGQVGVALFFVISGYCIAGAAYSVATSKKNVFAYFKDRVVRIYPPYVATCVFALLLGQLIKWAASHHFVPMPNHMRDSSEGSQTLFIFSNLTLTQHYFHQDRLMEIFWSLEYEIAFYAIVGVLSFSALLVARKRGLDPEQAAWLFLNGIHTLTTGALLVLIICPQYCSFPMDRWYQFGAGALLFHAFLDVPSNARARQTILRGFLWIIPILMLVFACLRSLGGDMINHPSTRIQAVATLIFILVLWIIKPIDERVSKRRLMRPLMFLGTISYSLYLTHTFFFGFVDAGLRRAHIEGPLYWITFTAQVIIGLITGYVFYIVVERPVLQLKKKPLVAGKENVPQLDNILRPVVVPLD